MYREKIAPVLPLTVFSMSIYLITEFINKIEHVIFFYVFSTQLFSIKLALSINWLV